MLQLNTAVIVFDDILECRRKRKNFYGDSNSPGFERGLYRKFREFNT